jgi:hypothetical protein
MNATHTPVIPAQPALPDETRGMLLGLAGVAIFSLTLPFTRMAVIAVVAAGRWMRIRR